MRSRLLATGAVSASLLALGLAGCGDDDGGSGDLASVVPPDVPLYAEAVVRPEGDQRDAIESLTEQVAGIEEPGERIIEEFDRSIAAEPGDFTYDDDIEPWLGERGALFVRSFEGNGEPEFALMFETTDAEAAEEFVDAVAESNPDDVDEERSYDDVDYRASEGGIAAGVIDDTLVVGTEDSFKVAVDASRGESLAESEEYTQRLEPLGDDGLGTVYLEPAAVVQAAITNGDVEPEAAQAIRPLLGGVLTESVAVGLSATEDSATIESVAAVDGPHPAVGETNLLEALPSGSWLAVEALDVGPALDRVFDEVSNSGIPNAGMFEREFRAETGLDLRRDLTGWLGDVAVFFKGTEIPGASFGLIAETSDPDAPRKLIETVQEIAEADSGLRSAAPPEGADYGFSLGIPGVGAGADVGVAGDRVVAALAASFAQVLDPDQTLADDESFQEAAEGLGDEYPPSLYLDVQQAYQLAELADDVDPAELEAARPYVEQLGTLVGGARLDEELLLSRVILTLAE